jgi:hypothetical protein
MNRSLASLLLSVALACAGAGTQGRETTPQWKERSAAQQIDDAVSKGQDPRKIRVCESEEVTGSRIRQVTCRDLDSAEQERAAARHQMMMLQQHIEKAKAD